MTSDKVLIEQPSLDLLNFFAKVNSEAKREKQMTIDYNQMSYWWTRKPLVVGRAIMLTSCLKNIDDVEQFAGLGLAKPYDHQPNMADFIKKLGKNPCEIKVLDPFGGAGNLMFPYVHFGFDCTISDYNPVAYILELCALRYPSLHDQSLATDIQHYANLALAETKKELGVLFGVHDLTYLWAWCIRCPYCSQRFPLLNQMYVVRTPKIKLGIKLLLSGADFKIQLTDKLGDQNGHMYTQKGGKATCPKCTNTIPSKTMMNIISNHPDREMLVVQAQGLQKREYRVANDADKKLHRDAVALFNSLRDKYVKDSLLPDEEILPSHRKKNTLWNYGITTWDQYFDPRQLLVLCTFMSKADYVTQQIANPTYRAIILTYLSLVLQKRVDHAGYGVVWDSGSTKPQHALSMRQPRLAYNFAESNPFAKINGSIVNIIGSVCRAAKFATRLTTVPVCKNQSVTKNDDQLYDIIVTDPPYGDDVQYGELSEFFYYWMRRMLNNYHSLPHRVPLDEDYCESQGRFQDKKTARRFFGEGLKKSFVAMSNKLKDDGLIVIVFAHSSTDAWNLFLKAVRGARLQIVSSYALHTEMATNVLARNKASFMSSIVVSCRKITNVSKGYFEDLIPKIDDSVIQMLDTIPRQDLMKLSITHLLIMVYGKVLEVCTQYTTLLSYSKDFNPDFEQLIKNAHGTIINLLIEKLLDKRPEIIGPGMSFYLTIKIFKGGRISADDALQIAKAYNTQINWLTKNCILTQEPDGTFVLTTLKQMPKYAPENVDPHDLYQQLIMLVSHMSHADDLLRHDNFSLSNLKPIVSLLIKYYDMKRTQDVDLSAADSEEHERLRAIADRMGINVSHDISLRVTTHKKKSLAERAKRAMGNQYQKPLPSGDENE